MSIRTINSRFNLRTVVEAETASHPLVLTQTQPSGMFSMPSTTPKPSGPGLKFDFAQLQSTPYGTAPTPQANLRPTQFSTPLKNAFGQPKDTSKADVMRLTAVVDDLTARMKRAQDRAVVAETHLQKTHTALVSERTNATEKIKGLTAQLSAAHSTESNLRGQLQMTIKNTSTVEARPTPAAFESAVSAVMAADGDAEKTKKEMDVLKTDLVERNLSITTLTSQIAELKAESVSLNETNSAVHRKFSEAVRELAEAREAERAAFAELERVDGELKDAKKRAEEAEAVAKTTLGPAEGAPNTTTDAGDDEAVAKSEAVDASLLSLVPPVQPHEPLPDDCNLGCCAKCASPLEDGEQQLPSVATSTPISTDSPATTEALVEKEPATVVALDPISMHAKYTQMRERVLKLTASIAKMQRSGKKEDLLAAMISKRDEVYRRAKQLKLQYDGIFGAVDPDSVVKLEMMETYNATAESNIHAEAEEYEFAPCGDAPQPPCTYMISFAKEMASNSAVGGAFHLGSYDSGVSIGGAIVHPITANGMPIDDDAKENVDPTEGHDAQKEMVTAVIADMTRLLKHVSSVHKAKQEAHDKDVITNGV